MRLDDEPLAADERICPASAEAGHKTHCVKCMACHGGNGVGLTILAHGSNWKPIRFRKVRMAQRQHRSYRELVKISEKSIRERVHGVKGRR